MATIKIYFDSILVTIPEYIYVTIHRLSIADHLQGRKYFLKTTIDLLCMHAKVTTTIVF